MLLFVVLVFLFSLASMSQGLGGAGRSAVTSNSGYIELADCGIRFPDPGRRTLYSSVTHTAFRELGQGRIERFVSDVALFDIGCIDLDDPFRKIPRAALIERLKPMTEAYFQDTLNFKTLSAARSGGRDVYEFESDTRVMHHVKYVVDGSRVFLFVARAVSRKEMQEALTLFRGVSDYSVRKSTEDSIASIAVPSLPQTPRLKTPQSDAAFNNLKGRVKHVRVETVDIPAGTFERRIKADETYDDAGNLLKSFWILENGVVSSARAYGFFDGMRVSDSAEFGGLGLGAAGLGESISATPLPEPVSKAYEYRYEKRFDEFNRLIERLEYDNRERLIGKYVYRYEGSWVEEKRFSTIELVSTTRRQFDKKGSVIKFEFWWYDQTDRVEESYEYKKFDRAGNWTERRVVRKIIDRGLVRFRTSDEFRVITYHANR